MIVLFTDFGTGGPYVGQMTAALRRDAPDAPVIELMSDAPAFDPRAAAYMLAALVPDFPADSVFLAVVDPGVGGERAPLVLRAHGRWFVGPDNGLLALVAGRDETARAWEITWRPERLSASFHGRDLFAPVAAGLAKGVMPAVEPRAPETLAGADWPEDLARVVYLDAFGNAMTGLRTASLPDGTALRAGDRQIGRARTFSDVARDQPFWYENAIGLAEIAVNQGHAGDVLGLTVGTEITVVTGRKRE